MIFWSGLTLMYNAVQLAVERANEPFFKNIQDFMTYQKTRYDLEAFFIKQGGYYTYANTDAMRCELMSRIQYNLGKVNREIDARGGSLSEEDAWQFLEFLSATRKAMAEPAERFRQHKVDFRDYMREGLVESALLEEEVLQKLLKVFGRMDRQQFFDRLVQRDVVPVYHVRVMNAVNAPEMQAPIANL